MNGIEISSLILKSHRKVYQITYKASKYQDQYISSFINMSFIKYRKWLKEKFGGIEYHNHDGIFFLNQIDAQRALDNINAIILANNLCGVK